jgi:hypothetical protein
LGKAYRDVSGVDSSTTRCLRELRTDLHDLRMVYGHASQSFFGFLALPL